MKITFTFLLLLFFAQNSTASSLYDQLCEFNYNWKKYSERAPHDASINFQSDQELIQSHLENVLVILRSNAVDYLSSEQYASRLHLIEVLEGYKNDGLFPMNYYRSERIPVFIDEHNTHCAVGFLLRESGHGEVAQRISSFNNYAWVKEIQDPALPAWQDASGFTLEELKLIQGAYFSYPPNAFHAPNKLEIPQEPKVITANFDKGHFNSQSKDKSPIWCYGEGSGEILHGRWEQNYRVGIPWIEGFYDTGSRTGQWKEYYKGTAILCRTENWRNDKLNGVRTRFDRQGNVIEKILFKDGNAVLKTNFDLADSLTYIRKPLDSNLVHTEVYTTGGGLIASGNERIYNPSGLLWFQNIELTALNSASITSRDASSSYEAQIGAAPGQANSRGMVSFDNKPSLVEYHKDGEWIYYPEHNRDLKVELAIKSVQFSLAKDYKHMGPKLSYFFKDFNHLNLKSGYDSLIVNYDGNKITEFIGSGTHDYTRIQLGYHVAIPVLPKANDIRHSSINSSYLQHPSSRYIPEIYRTTNFNGFQFQQPDYLWNITATHEIGQLDKQSRRIGVWQSYNLQGKLYKTEKYIIPWKEERADL
ncbi:MAG: hypothetical protein ACJASQ_002253 [Crocinitomicaceae bacterium]|jgi:hypothetical protein